MLSSIVQLLLSSCSATMSVDKFLALLCVCSLSSVMAVERNVKHDFKQKTWSGLRKEITMVCMFPNFTCQWRTGKGALRVIMHKLAISIWFNECSFQTWQKTLHFLLDFRHAVVKTKCLVKSDKLQTWMVQLCGQRVSLSFSELWLLQREVHPPPPPPLWSNFNTKNLVMGGTLA